MGRHVKAGEKSSAETVRRDKRGKKWVNLCFAFAFSRGVVHRFAATWRLSRSRRSRRPDAHRGAWPDGRCGLSFRAMLAATLFESCPSENESIPANSLIKGDTEEQSGRTRAIYRK